MSFTFDDNKTHPIAVIQDPRGQSYVYLSDTEVEDQPPAQQSSILDEKLDQTTLQQVMASLNSMSLRQVYSILDQSTPHSQSQKSNFNEYHLNPDESIETLPAANTERIFIAGEAGCGKSTISAKYAMQYKKMFPENDIFLFARQEDPAFDKIKHNEIILDFDFPDDGNKEDIDKVLHNEITIDSLENSLCIFDDCDNLQDIKLLTAIHKLMNDVTTNGRKRGIYVIYVSHLLMNYAQTRVMLNEANKVFFFPGCGTRQIENFLKIYGSMKTKEAEQLANMKSRWVMLAKRRPRYILHEKGFFML